MQPFSIFVFGIVSLFFSCLSAKPLHLPDFRIGSLKKYVKCDQEATFYTPQGVQDQCLGAAMKCFQEELKTVQAECEDPEGRINITMSAFEQYSNVSRNSTDCACENWSPQPFHTFVDKIKDLIKQVNAASA